MFAQNLTPKRVCSVVRWYYPNVENVSDAKKWKDMFEEAKTIVATECELYTKDFEGKTGLIVHLYYKKQ